MLELPQVNLTDEERALLDQIEFDVRVLDPDGVESNGEAVVELTHSLLSRDAVPKHRLDYFTDPEYNIGARGRSRAGMFERNGRLRGDDVFRHPHFLPHLRYFVHGADLPAAAAAEFCSAVDDCGMVTSSDVVPLGLLARRLARKHGLTRDEARDEFFKLALDCGLDVGTAASIRESAGKQ